MQKSQQARWDTVIRPRKGWFDLDLKGLFKYRDLILLMVKRNFTVLYKQTILGPAWVVIQPLLTTLVFTVIFGKVAGLPTDGMPMFVFYMGGSVCWNFFANCLTNTSNTFIKNSDLFGKVYFPRLCVPISCPAFTIFSTYSGYFSTQNCTAKKVQRTLYSSITASNSSVCSTPHAQSKLIEIFFSSVSTE